VWGWAGSLWLLRAYPSGYEYIKSVRKSVERLDPAKEKKTWQRFSVVDFYRGLLVLNR